MTHRAMHCKPPHPHPPKKQPKKPKKKTTSNKSLLSLFLQKVNIHILSTRGPQRLLGNTPGVDDLFVMKPVSKCISS